MPLRNQGKHVKIISIEIIMPLWKMENILIINDLFQDHIKKLYSLNPRVIE